MLADILHKARNSYSRATRVRVVWTVQAIEQSVWTLKELLHSAKTAYEAGVQLEIELYVTRGMSTPSPEAVDLMTKELPPPPTLQVRRASVMSVNSYAESPIADALTILPGRPAIDVIVPRWIANAQGKSLVVGASSRFLSRAGSVQLLTLSSSACGPTPMAQAVRLETTKYISVYPVSLEIALFEC